MEPTPEPSRIALLLPWTTIFKVFAALLLALAIVRLADFVLMLLLAVLIAMTLSPLLNRMVQWGWPRPLGIALCAALLAGILALLVGLLVPAVSSQGHELLQRLPNFKENLLGKLPQGGLQETAKGLLASPTFTNPQPLMERFVVWSSVAVQGLAQFLLVLVLALYFLADGDRTYRWLEAFLPPAHRAKVAEAAPEVVIVVGHYVGGQFIISLCCGIFSFSLLMLFRVPNAAFLAVFAACLDVFPLIGITITMLLGMALALIVSPLTALWVGLAFFGYHMFENYYLVPAVYGQRLRLSALTVLLSFLAGVEVVGIVGAILALPIAASYPIVERLWLRPYLERDTIRRHEALAEE